ncbi:MAG TPA: glycerophosphodiester phosphodiesterase family protein [Candidatus Limnocylindrales bacterium]|nr:glycerophosphodiester phosphodiesterase family protein [Candidatus Limnocylindrales bacterium]
MSRRVDNPWRRSAPLAVAHRGQRATFPEQTLEAYVEAIRLGADGIETDVQRTRDGQLVMLHDLTVDRTTDGHGPIASLDWGEARALDAGSWRGAPFAGARIPTLDETIELVVGAGLMLCVEIKGTAADAPASAIAVARLIRDRGLVDQVFISSFDHAALAAARDEVGSPLLAPERLPEAGPSDPDVAVAQAAALDAAVLQHRWEDLPPEVVDALHAAGTAVWSWPIDTLESIRRSVELGCDGVIGDDVPLLLEGLGRAAVADAPGPSPEW